MPSIPETIPDMMVRAMRRLAATVHLVTIFADGQPMGMAATSVTSLSLDPPSLLLCVNRTASIYSSLRPGTAFAVNMLHADQRALVGRFSSADERHRRFEDADWDMSGPAPVLAGAQASFSCVLAERHAFGTHAIVIGRIEDARIQEAINPLVYLAGQFLAIETVQAIP